MGGFCFIREADKKKKPRARIPAAPSASALHLHVPVGPVVICIAHLDSSIGTLRTCACSRVLVAIPKGKTITEDQSSKSTANFSHVSLIHSQILHSSGSNHSSQ